VFRPSGAREDEDLFDALARRLTTQLSEEEGVSELIGPGQSLASLAAHLRNATAEPAYPIGTALGQLALKARQDGRIGWARMSRLAPGEGIHQLSDTHRAKRRTTPRSLSVVRYRSTFGRR
jgi:hypothetical protein